MYRTLDDLEGRYVVVPPGEGVSLASLGVPPYSPPDPAWEDDGRMPAASDVEAPEISFADWVRTISPATEPGAWREDNRAPFWSPDDPRAQSGPSFDDLVRTIDPTPQTSGWDEAERYAASYDPRAAALGAFRIPGLPEDATGWSLRDPMPAGVDEIPPVRLASRDLLLRLWRMWKEMGGVPGGRRPDGPPASAPSGHRGDPLKSPPDPSRNPPGEIDKRPHSGHGFDKMQNEGIPPSVVRQAIRQGSPRPGKYPGTTRYYDEVNDVSVVVNDKTGNVITTRYGNR